jgi:UDPglucose 6-dehydrogenase
MREAPSLDIIPVIQAAGAKVKVHDPVAMTVAHKLLPDVEWCASPYDAAEGADVVALLTEWNAYRALDLKRLAGSMRSKVLFDARNVYQPADLAGTGLVCHGVGRQRVE